MSFAKTGAFGTWCRMPSTKFVSKVMKMKCLGEADTNLFHVAVTIYFAKSRLLCTPILGTWNLLISN